MWRETMTSPERMGAVMEGEKPDRVPVIPFLSATPPWSAASRSPGCSTMPSELPLPVAGGRDVRLRRALLYAYASPGLGVRRRDRDPA